MGFSQQESWSEMPIPFPGDLPDPGIKPRFRELQVDPLPSEPPGKPFKESFYTDSHLVDMADFGCVCLQEAELKPHM